MNDQNNIPFDDLALYAMNLMSDIERAAFEQRLAAEPALQQELASMQDDLAALALSVEMVDAPPMARTRFLNQISIENSAKVIQEERKAASPTLTAAPTSTPVERNDSAKRRRNSTPFIFGGLGWALAAGLAFGIFTLNRDRESLRRDLIQKNDAMALATQQSERAKLVLDTVTSPESQRFALAKTATTPPASGRVMYLAEKGSLIFQGNNLDPLPTAKSYELWIIPAEAGKAPIPAGTFKPDARGYATLIMPDLPKGIVAGKIGVTIEDDGGSQTPTMPIVMIGQ